MPQRGHLRGLKLRNAEMRSESSLAHPGARQIAATQIEAYLFSIRPCSCKQANTKSDVI